MSADLAVARRFGANLRKARQQVDLSQEEVGALASLHRTEIGLLERGARVPRIDTLIKIAAALGIRIDCSLLDGISWTPGSTKAGAFTLSSPSKRSPDLRERAAALRARQKEPTDVVKLVQESRDELEQRAERWKEPEKEE